MNDIDIGRRVRQERERLSMPQAVLARKVGMADHKLSKIESGGRMVSAFELLRIASALEMDPFDLYYPRPAAMSLRGDGESPGIEEALEIFENFIRDCRVVDQMTIRVNS